MNSDDMLIDMVGNSARSNLRSLKIGGLTFPTNNRKRLRPTLKTAQLYIPEQNIQNAVKLAFETERFDDIYRLHQIRKSSTSKDILFTCQYTDSSSRLHTSLQQVAKPIRAALFAGWYDVDIHTAMPTLIAQRSPIPCPLLNQYISDKNELRNHICNILNCDLPTAKHIISAAFYGVRTHTGTVYWDLGNMEPITYFVKSLGLKAKRLVNDPICKAFFEEVRQVAQAIANDIKPTCEKIRGYWYYHNDHNDLLKLKRNWNSGKICSHWYFGLERTILSLLDQSDTNLLLVHDSVTSKSPINTQNLEHQVYEHTGYSIKLGGKLLTH